MKRRNWLKISEIRIEYVREKESLRKLNGEKQQLTKYIDR